MCDNRQLDIVQANGLKDYIIMTHLPVSLFKFNDKVVSLTPHVKILE